MPYRLAGLVIIQIVKIVTHAPCRWAGGDHPVRHEEAGVDYFLFTVYLNALVIGAKKHDSPLYVIFASAVAPGEPFISRRQWHLPAQGIRRALRRPGFS
jgi:hypothetical protein